MSWVTRDFSKSQIDRAGRILARQPNAAANEREWARGVLSNWRSCHAYPLNTFQATLRARAARIGHSFVVSQRLKRRTSIVKKLQRFSTMQLSTMQDIGGLRCILGSMQQVDALFNAYRDGRLSHDLRRCDDYIRSPKDSGYRGVHLVYRYKRTSDPLAFNGLHVELQLRSNVQHAWAMAVETAGLFLHQALKSSEGPEEWLDFFRLCSSAFAKLEGQPVLAEHTEYAEEVEQRCAQAAHHLHVIDTFETYPLLAKKLEQTRARRGLNVFVLDVRARQLFGIGYPLSDLQRAEEDYSAYEATHRNDPSVHVFLVQARSLDELKLAYPSFFFDTSMFLFLLRKVTEHTQ
ncbi:MAG: RelA/SpoT domain-containing protein [Planctomycetota bacterium]